MGMGLVRTEDLGETFFHNVEAISGVLPHNPFLQINP